VTNNNLTPELVKLLNTLERPHDGRIPSPAEGLALIKAFMEIRNASTRAAIVEFVERIAVIRSSQR
jgi:hypothetical protein